MKRILLLLLLIPVVKVKAATYYGEYKDYLQNTENYIEESDILKREEIKMYNTYETKEKELGYANKDSCKYYYEDKMQENSVYSKTPFKNDDKLYQAFEIYDWQIRGVSLNKVKNTYLTLYEIISKNKGQHQALDIISTSMPTHMNIIDGDLTTSIALANKSIFNIQYDNVLANDLTIEFVSNPMIHTEVRFTTINPSTQQNTVRQFVINANIVEFKSSEEISRIKAQIGDFDNINTLGTYYKSSEIQHLCYDYENVALNKYVVTGDNIIKDDYKIFYNYQKRDYITLDDVTLSKKINLKDLISSTSYNLSDIEVEDNINYSKSGTYEIIYKVNGDKYIHEVEYKYIKPTTTTTSTTTSTTTTTTNMPTTSTTYIDKVVTTKAKNTTTNNLILETEEVTINSLRETTNQVTTTTTKIIDENIEDIDYEDPTTIKIIIISLILLFILILTLYFTYKKS